MIERREPSPQSAGRRLQSIFADRKIGTKVVAGFVLLLAMTAIIGLMAVRSTASLAGFTTNLYEHPFRVTRALLEAKVELLTIQRDVRDAIMAKDRAGVDQIASNVERSERIIAERLALAEQQFLGDKQTFVSLGKAIEDYKPIYHELLALARQGKTDAAMAMMHEKGNLQIEVVGKAMDDVLDFAHRASNNFLERAGATDRQISTMTIGLLAGALLLGLIVAVLISRSISVPLRGLNGGMAQLAAGNFDVILPGLGRKDEVGEMAQAVEAFKVKAMEKARREAEEQETQARAAAAARKADMHKLADEFESAVGGIVDAVSSASTELEATASTLTRTAASTQELSTDVAAASGQASTNVQSVASASEELAASVSEIARQVHESSRIAGNAVKQAEMTDARITKLSQSAQRIGDVVKLITAIAEQTNLLALNATIEAARAGDAGKGFAVVAQEVKALAAQTAKATDEIGTQISGMQAATQESVAAIKEIGGTIAHISEIAATIAAAVEEQGAATQDIARNVQQAARGTDQVASNITRVSRGAGETGSASAQVLASAQSLANEGSHLKLEVHKFLSTVRAA